MVQPVRFTGVSVKGTVHQICHSTQMETFKNNSTLI